MLWNKVKAVLMFSVRIFACFSFSKSFEKHFVKYGNYSNGTYDYSRTI